MRGYTPRIEISGASPLFYSRLIKATVKDEEGQKADTLTIELDDRGNAIPVPKKSTKLEVRLGYVETGLVKIGTFEVHGTELKGAAGEGEQVIIQAKGTSLASSRKLKETGSETFKEGSTLKDVAAKVAERNGLTLRLDEGLAGLKFPDGVFRFMQSDLDFISRLVEPVGAAVYARALMQLNARAPAQVLILGSGGIALTLAIVLTRDGHAVTLSPSCPEHAAQLDGVLEGCPRLRIVPRADLGRSGLRADAAAVMVSRGGCRAAVSQALGALKPGGILDLVVQSRHLMDWIENESIRL